MIGNRQPRDTAGTLYWCGFLVLLAVALFFLWTEHRAHLLGVLPYAIALLCRYASETPAFIPHLRRPCATTHQGKARA